MDWDALRQRMVEKQIISRGLTEPSLLQAMRSVPRHLFVPEEIQDKAYEDRAMPIGFNQTISQPYMVALMLNALKLTGTEKVLEIGTGSGYQAALLSLLCREVHTVEIIPKLADAARPRLQPYSNVTIYARDGSAGLPERAPFDAVIVAAATAAVPPAWTQQLKVGGKLLVPLKSGRHEVLTSFEKTAEGMREQRLGDCAFVPLTGEAG